MDKGGFVYSLNPCRQELHMVALDIPRVALEWMHKWVSECGKKKSKQYFLNKHKGSGFLSLFPWVLPWWTNT